MYIDGDKLSVESMKDDYTNHSFYVGVGAVATDAYGDSAEEALFCKDEEGGQLYLGFDKVNGAGEELAGCSLLAFGIENSYTSSDSKVRLQRLHYMKNGGQTIAVERRVEKVGEKTSITYKIIGQNDPNLFKQNGLLPPGLIGS